jgi:hypothetical protein
MGDSMEFDKKWLAGLEGTALFYPCSGEDLLVPIKLFAPTVREFWFVDTDYFRSDTGRLWEGLPADQVKPLLADKRLYLLDAQSVVGLPAAAMERRKDARGETYPDLEPCVLTETYLHRPTGNKIKIHRRRGFGKTAFNNLQMSLGVFFYRGDSMGESGSGNLWLSRQCVQSIVKKLVSGGLLVTDGSQHDKAKKYRELWQFRDVGKKAMELAKPFEKDGCSFRCVGYAGDRSRPTLIWKVDKLP